MPSLFIFKIFAALFILITSLIAGLVPIHLSLNKKNRQMLAFGEALAGGIFLGAALFHMLPDAIAKFQIVVGESDFPYANALCALGFVLLLFFEKVIFHLRRNRIVDNAYIIPYILSVVLGIHALSEGTALGINSSTASTLIIFVAIIVHKSSESFALAMSLVKSHMTLFRITSIFLLFAMMTPLGILLSSLTVYIQPQTYTHEILEAGFTSFAAGTFLYIATLHNLHHHHESNDLNHLWEFVAVVIGLCVMGVLAIWI